MYNGLLFWATVYVEDGDVDLECLATWKDGSQLYLYGRLSGTSIDNNHYDDGFRCFVRVKQCRSY